MPLVEYGWLDILIVVPTLTLLMVLLYQQVEQFITDLYLFWIGEDR